MKVLALDTTSEQGSLALLDGEQLVEEVELLGPDGFAQLLYPALQDLLVRNHWAIQQIGLFAAASGPGSFTGVRVGLAAVKGLAEATGGLAQSVSNLRAIAGLGSGPLRMPLINARRGEAYAGIYDAALGPTSEERCGRLEQFLAGRPEGVELICRESWPELVAGDVEFVADGRPLAGIVGRLALQDGGVDPAALDANYVRKSDADGRWEDAWNYSEQSRT